MPALVPTPSIAVTIGGQERIYHAFVTTAAPNRRATPQQVNQRVFRRRSEGATSADLISRRDPVALEHAAFERHYRIGDLAEMWKLGRETVRLLVKDEQGVIKIRLGRNERTPSTRCRNQWPSASTRAC